MKVLHIDYTADGRFASGVVLHNTLAHLGVASYLAVAELGYAPQAGVVALFRGDTAEKSVDSLSDTARRLLAAADVVHLHTSVTMVAGTVLQFLLGLANKPLLVWSINDANAYTGGCTYSAVCEQWRGDCGDCPLLTPPQTSAKAPVLALKRDLYSKLPMVVIANSAWQGSQLAQSILAAQARFVAPPVVANNYFFPGDRQAARLALGLPVDSVILLYEAAGKKAFTALYQAARSFVDRLVPVLIVCVNCQSADAIRSIDKPSAALLGEYYRAADLYVDLRESGTYPMVPAAAACGCPSLVLERGAARELVTAETGFVITAVAGKEIFATLSKLVYDENALATLRRGCLTVSQAKYNNLSTAKGYQALYNQLLAARQSSAGEVSVEQAAQLVLLRGNGAALQAELERLLALIPAAQNRRRDIVVDRFCRACLSGKDVLADYYYLWDILALWMDKRSKLDLKEVAVDDIDDTYLGVVTDFRRALVRWFTTFDLRIYSLIEPKYINQICRLWRDVFLNTKSFLHTMNKDTALPDFAAYDVRKGYPYVCLQTMFVPYYEGEAGWGAKAIVESPQRSLFFIFTMWLLQVPLYDATPVHQRLSLKYFTEIAQQVTQAAVLNKGECHFLSIVFMNSLWRLSYLGGNIASASRAYGDFLQMMVRRFYPEFAKPVAPNHRPKKFGKIRVGYVSFRFRHQAVTLYMGNRIFSRDRQRFFVKGIYLAEQGDELTKRVRQSCDEFVEFPVNGDPDWLHKLAQEIKKNKFDILIYPDIGMDEVTFLMGAMRLAPVQLVMMGHCMTSGLTTLDYYISGDHEPPAADSHYVEKLVRLPNLGACQLPPAQNSTTLTRAAIGVPADAVMFVSCANGLKHGKERDHLLMEILQKTPQAYIVLKPFLDSKGIDQHFVARLKALAAANGVGERLIILNPFKSPGDLMGLLCLADIQLDTYPYGGWTTNLEALYYHLPMVTQLGDTGRSCWGAKMLEALGIDVGIARDERDYVAWAVKLATDHALREQVRQQIAERVEAVLFNEKSGQAAFEEFLRSIVKYR